LSSLYLKTSLSETSLSNEASLAGTRFADDTSFDNACRRALYSHWSHLDSPWLEWLDRPLQDRPSHQENQEG
jgi:hypothetical protein